MPRTPNPTMRRAGYASAAQVAKALCKVLSTIHRMAKRGDVACLRDGDCLYLSIADLEKKYAANPWIFRRVNALRTRAGRMNDAATNAEPANEGPARE